MKKNIACLVNSRRWVVGRVLSMRISVGVLNKRRPAQFGWTIRVESPNPGGAAGCQCAIRMPLLQNNHTSGTSPGLPLMI